MKSRNSLDGTQAVAFCVATTKQERYQWVQNTLVTFRYMQSNKADKGLITCLLMKVTGYSHAQIKRLIQQYRTSGVITVTKTRPNPKAVMIGQRCKPSPNNQLGYIRIDSVHQGDQDKRKGVYHINTVDEVTQMQVVVTVARITEAFMLPALEQILATFPFEIRGFHADNGGEYINYSVTELVETRRIELTKFRPDTVMTTPW